MDIESLGFCRPPRYKEIVVVMLAGLGMQSTFAAKPTDSTTPVTSSGAVLSASLSTLAVKTGGNPRIITINNTGNEAATNVRYNLSSELPTGTSIFPASCDLIQPTKSCILVVSPGKTPSAVPGDLTPTPIKLTIQGDYTNSLITEINILTYGSVFQSGFIFAIDDKLPPEQSIGGKVAALTDQARHNMAWGTETIAIGGINENSKASASSCNGSIDGFCNTQRIVEQVSKQKEHQLNEYAAGLCKTEIGGYTDWYLPAICEIGYSLYINDNAHCGTKSHPTIQNMQSNLRDNYVSTVGSISGLWSSTEASTGGNFFAWMHDEIPSDSRLQEKDIRYSVRCVRALTP